MDVFQNQLIFRAESRMREILKPLETMSDIHYFCYGINYPDTSGFTLITHGDYYKAIFEQQFHLCGFSHNSGWHNRDASISNKELEFTQNMDIGNQICYIDRHADSTEIFVFGTRPDNKKIEDFYLNNLNLLKRFTQHFKYEAKNLLEKANTQLVYPHPSMLKPEGIVLNPLSESSQYEKQIYPFNILSDREGLCYILLLRGYTNTEIANKLLISSKSVDVYVSRLKIKLNCAKKTDLFQKAKELGLFESEIF